ncbi:MAG: carboxymuconolactone decarboxylase family protein [Acidobacteria bacterium]|nr:carboxymuconolactone decarboxylase family protein [Acidobacteriota bacterium]
MKQRISLTNINKDAYQAMLGLEMYLGKSSIEKPLLHLLKFRVSQINGCAYCLDMHSKDLRALGETEQRLFVLDAWREAPFYTDRERAALLWAESLTKITEGHVPDAVFEEARKHFSEQELVDLTLAVTTINAWNRISIGFRVEVGNYQPHHTAAK